MMLVEGCWIRHGTTLQGRGINLVSKRVLIMLNHFGKKTFFSLLPSNASGRDHRTPVTPRRAAQRSAISSLGAS